MITMRKRFAGRVVPFICLVALVSAIPVCAATYYVDAAGGDDANAGTSESAAWKTLGKVNASSFNPGDMILLRRGRRWREELVVPSSGLSGSPIVFGAYGSGDKPLISGAGLVQNWTAKSGMIHAAPCNFHDIDSVWQDNVFLSQKAALAEITGPGQYWVDAANGSLYLWSRSGQSPEGTVVEAGKDPSALSAAGKDWIVVRDLTLEKNRALTYGIVTLEACNHWTITGCEIRYSAKQAYGIKVTGGSHVTVENCRVHDTRNTAIYFREASTYGTVRNCAVYSAGRNNDAGDNGAICFGGVQKVSCNQCLIEGNDVFNTGFGDPQGHNQTVLVDRADGCVIRFNRVHRSVKGGIYAAGEPGRHIKGLRVYGNLVFDVNLKHEVHMGYAPGIGIRDVEDARVFNNTIWNVGASSWSDSPLMITGTGGEVLPGVRIANNIVGPATNPARHRNYITREYASFPGLTSDYNLFADPAGVVILDNDVSFAGLATYRTAHPEAESRSREGLPTFRSEPTEDFQLAAGSMGVRMAPDAMDFDADGDLSEIVNVGAYAFGAETIGTTWLTDGDRKPPLPPKGLKGIP